ncbi:c-type cytochrome [Kushneria indalinina]|uniref:Cytochrome c5 n=1 Tax=Kushneria indalinina DSM 14324 TaxID=1122140 RepID=A0A3D9DW06_9GAMM|nr:c-type cytochrome [Kushneria indalinina]REC94937.1 cytochrome c5 [Kushneria indalinina DSM 14324]
MRKRCTALTLATAMVAGLLTTTATAYADDLDGRQIYDDNCASCHDGGRGPQRGAERWQSRLDEGSETLYTHAIEGFRGMPARGGNEDLSDEEVKAGVDYLVAPVEDE